MVKSVKLKVKSAKTLNLKPSTLNGHLFNEAKRYIPGGVNSPVRSFKAVKGKPIFIKKANGARIYSESAEEFIDFCLSWGALILGHAHKEVVSAVERTARRGTSFGAATRLEIELAKLVTEAVPSIEQVRLTNSGTEAVMGAIRLARAYTKRSKIIKFKGSYHGNADYLLDGPGIPEEFTKSTLTAPYNDIEEFKRIADTHKDGLAAIIVEPVAGNCGVILPRFGFLKALRYIADKYGVVLIFDEVITGFRVSYGGAQTLFDIRPDLTCLGKIIGGGLPVGAFGGRRDIMQLLAPEGNVHQAGTLSGNPVAVTAGITTLKILRDINPYDELKDKTQRLCQEIKASAKRYDIKLRVNYIGSMFSVFFGEKGQDIDLSFDGAKTAAFRPRIRKAPLRITPSKSPGLKAGDASRGLFKRFFHGLLKRGVYFSPSGLEADFLSTAHSNKDIEKTLKAANDIFKTWRIK